MNKYLFLLFVVVSLFFTACSSGIRTDRFAVSRKVDPSIASGATDYTFLDYSSYVIFKTNLIKLNRIYTDLSKKDMEVALNAPYEVAPSKSLCPNFDINNPQRGIVLIHGIDATPFSMGDLANYFASRCFLVRTVLLPGYGTRVGNLSDISYFNWIKDAKFVIQTMKNDHVQKIYIGGHSLGGTLAAYLAIREQKNIKGLFLFAPILNWNMARVSTMLYSFFVPFHYDSIPINDFAQYTAHSLNADHQLAFLASKLHEKLEKFGMKIPVFMVESTLDNEVSLEDNVQAFTKDMYNSKDRLYLYSSNNYEDLSNLQDYFLDKRVIFLNSFHPELRILSQSHYSIIISPNNFHYGKHGDYRDCEYLLKSAFGEEMSNYNNCMTNSNAYYGEIGGTLTKYYKSMRRIRYNPDFYDMTKKMDNFLKSIE